MPINTVSQFIDIRTELDALYGALGATLATGDHDQTGDRGLR